MPAPANTSPVGVSSTIISKTFFWLSNSDFFTLEFTDLKIPLDLILFIDLSNKALLNNQQYIADKSLDLIDKLDTSYLNTLNKLDTILSSIVTNQQESETNITDINTALNYKCQFLKYYPAEKSGGIRNLNTLINKNKLSELKFIAMGGINSSNIKAYLKHNNIVGIGLSWIANENLVENSNWIEINRRAQLIMDL